MNWIEGYSASYVLTEVDPKSWRDKSTIDITGGSITKGTSGLIESADIDVTDNLGERWVRIWLYAKQNDDGGREALFTGLLQTPGVKWDGIRDSYSAECYSVLKPAADVLLPRGWYVLSGSNGAKAVANLLAVSPAPVEVDGEAPYLTDTIVAEEGETNLTMAWKIMDSLGWRMKISGHGDITLQPVPEEPAIVMDSQENDIVEPDVTDSQDLYSCPNVFRAISGDLTAVAKDEDVDSPLSIQSRGREIWAEENATLNSNEGIAEYARRRLMELQSPARKITYNRRFTPDVYPGDVVQLRNSEQNISGKFRITSQKIDLGYGARTSEEAVFIKERTFMPPMYDDNATLGVVDIGRVGYAIVGKSSV